jgi:hypothetical protein
MTRYSMLLWRSACGRTDGTLAGTGAGAFRKEAIAGMLNTAKPSNASVFLVHGRNKAEVAAVVALLEKMSVTVRLWEDGIALTGKTDPHAREVLEAGMRDICAVVVLMTGDDQGSLRPEFYSADEEEAEKILHPRARQNVIFEAGLASALFPGRTILVKSGRVVFPSDLGGVQYVMLDAKTTLARRLRLAGCRIPDDFEKTSDPPPPDDPSLPPTNNTPKGRIALLRVLRSFMPFPGFGGNSEITNEAKIGEQLTVSAVVDDPLQLRRIDHWLPGEVAPKTIPSANAATRHGITEVPVTLTAPAGIHFFDLRASAAGKPEDEIVARISCRVTE